jgi:multidrug efflux pump subunit AcrA (membrane-fusion protein)
MVERCPKPGCGALRKLGHPCTDWDCPQQQVHHTDYAALEAERQAAVKRAEEAERRLDLELDAYAKDSDLARLARESEALRKALEDISSGDLTLGESRKVARTALNPTTASKETPAFSAPAISPETQAAIDAIDEAQRAAARMANVFIVGEQTEETSHGQD